MFDENGGKFSKRMENTVGKGEIARYEQFLLFPKCFQTTCTADTLKHGLVWEMVNQCVHDALDGRVNSHFVILYLSIEFFTWIFHSEFMAQPAKTPKCHTCLFNVIQCNSRSYCILLHI